MLHIKRKCKVYSILLALITIILFSGFTPLFNDYFYQSYKEFEDRNLREKKSKINSAYNPLYDDFLHISNVDHPIYNFNAEGKCHIITDLNGTDFTSFFLDEEKYNVSYGLNSFPIDFGDEPTSHIIEFKHLDISDKNFKWFCVEPLFIAQDNITVDLNQKTTFSFYAGGPISILLQPNFSYNWLYLEVDGRIINDIYDMSEYPEIESSFYSYFIEDGSYLQFDLNMIPKIHTIKIKGNGSLQYKILVNLDWDQDLLDDVDEVQKEFLYDELDPTIPNIWGRFEKSNEFTFIPNSVGNKTGYFYFYLPESKGDNNYFSIDLYSGTIFEVIIDEDFSTVIDLVLTTNYQSKPVTQFCRKISPGHHYIQYEYDSSLPTEISFRINSFKILVVKNKGLIDIDSDGLKDNEEISSGLDPQNSDTDQDDLPDDMDPSPLASLTLRQDQLYQFVLPHNETKDSVIEFNLKRPTIDYSTNGIPCKWHNSLDVNIMLVMRIFGNKSIMRDELVEFWKGDKGNVQEYKFVEDYNSRGANDAIPHPKYPYSDYNLITGTPSEDTIYYELIYPKGHPAKDDNVIDIRFDFIWLVTRYDEETESSSVLHYYDVEEDLILESMMYREYGKVNYTVGTPDSMIENQMLWAVTQNSQLSNNLGNDLTDDIKFQGETDYLDLGLQLMLDHGVGVYPAKYGFEDVDLSSWNLLGQDGVYFDIIDEFKGHTKVLSIYDRKKSNEVDLPRAEQNFGSTIFNGAVEFWFATSDIRNNYTYVILGEPNKNLGIIRIGGYRGEVQYYQRGFLISFPAWRTIGYIESNKWHHMRIEFNYFPEFFTIFLDGKMFQTMLFSEAPSGILGGFTKISFAVRNEFSIEKSFFIDALDYSWAPNYAWGRNKKPIYNNNTPSSSENEVIYVAGFQKNCDILNKINLLERYPNPSPETLNSKDYSLYNSYYYVYNLHSSENYTFLDEEIRGDQKICYTNEYFEYSANNQEYYEQRANIEGYPIKLELIEFQNSKVLKICQAFGNAIPLMQIPHSIEEHLHEQIVLQNQTYIERFESEDAILPIHFIETRDIYKGSFDNRIWEVESSGLVFTKDKVTGSFAETFTAQIEDIKDLSDDLIGSVLELVKKGVEGFNKKLLDIFLKHVDRKDPWSKFKILDDLETEKMMLENAPPIFEEVMDISNRLDTAKKAVEAEKGKVETKGKLVEGLVTFITSAYKIFQIMQLSEKPPYIALMWIEALSNLIVSAITVFYSGYVLFKGVNFGVAFSEGFGKVLKYVGKACFWVGLVLDVLISVWEIFETYAGFFGFIMINIITLSLDIIVGFALLNPAVIVGSYGFSILAFVLYEIFVSPLLGDWYASLATPEMIVIEEESDVILPDQNIRKHGGLEVGDPVSYKLVLKNTGADWQRTYARAKFEIDGVETKYQGRWRNRLPDPKAGWDISPCYQKGQRFDETLTVNIPNPTESLVGHLTLEIGGIQLSLGWWWRTPNLYGPETTSINFGIPVLQNNIADFFADTQELPDFKTVEMLEMELNLAMSQYRWKDADEILNRIKEFVPDYPLTLPTTTNIDSDLKKNRIEIEPSIGEITTNFEFGVDGWDNPNIDYKFIAPEGFSITPNYFPKQSLMGYQGTYNFDYEMEEGYYYGTYDFNYEMEKDLYYGTYNFRGDTVGKAPRGWSTTNDIEFLGIQFSRKNFVSVDESVDGHKKVVRLHDRDNVNDLAIAGLYQTFPQSRTSGAIEFWFRTDDAEKATHMTVREGSDDKICLKVESNQVLVYCFRRIIGTFGEYLWLATGIEVQDDTWIHFKITFDCAADSFNFYVNQVEFVPSPFLDILLKFANDGASQLDGIFLTTEGKDGWYSSWFDAIGYSWDDWSHDGIGYQTGWNTHPYNLIPFINDGWKFNPSIGCSVKIIDELDGHKNVMDLHDNTGRAILDMSRDILPKQTSGTIEFWWRVDDTQKSIALGLGYGSLLGPRVYIRSNGFYYYDGSYHRIKAGALPDTWYHIRIEFECGDNGYKGLSADRFNVYIDGEKCGPFPFHSSLSAINKLEIWSSTSYYGYHAYFDAIGYSWDGWSHEGLGYKPGCNLNHFDITPLLKDGFNNIQLKNWGMIESAYTNSITTSNEIDGHKNVLVLKETPTKIYKYFDAQTSGTVEWWMRTESSNYQTVLGIGPDISIGFSNNHIAFYTNGWTYTEIPVDENTWYHFRIDFECGGSGYEGLSANSFYVYINDDEYGPFLFPNPKTSIDYIYMEMTQNSFEYGDPFSSYFDGIGFSWDNNYTIGGNLNKGLNFNLFAINPDEVIAGTYYFSIEIRLNGTGELIFFDQIPFEVLVSRDLEYSQSNVIFREMLNFGLNQNSPVYPESKHLNIGNIFNIKCKTNTTNEILLDLIYNGQITRQFLMLPKGNLKFEEQFIQILINEPVSFNQLRFSGNLEDNEEFVILDILIMDSSITTPSEEIFNPVNLKNNGNVPEFIAFSFSGVPFEFVDTSLYPDEFQGERQIFTLMPGESKMCLFNISNPMESISNLYSRGIIAKHPITDDIYLSYIDNFRTDGIYIDSPKNITYNNFGVLNQGIHLNIITEEELVWLGYSLDNQPTIEFSNNEIIPIPENSGTHKIQVFGRDSADNLISSEPRYFSVEYALKMSVPENITYYKPMSGYYIATFGFENEKLGSSGKEIEFIDFDNSTGNSQVVVLDELDGHKMILDCHNTQYGMWQILHEIEENIVSGTIEFYWRTHSLSVSPWIFSFLDKDKKWGVILYQNKSDGGDLYYKNRVGFHDLDYKPSIDTWHHFKIDIDVAAKKWDLWIDGNIIGDKLTFHDLDVMNIGYIKLQGQDRYAFHTYYDAISFSWDDDYKVGDNLKEGLLLSYSSNPLIDDQIEYSLDRGQEHPFPDNPVISLPKNGLHSIRFYATRPCGEIIQSKLIEFTVARYIELLTPESELYTEPMRGFYKGTYGFDDPDLSQWTNTRFRTVNVIPKRGSHNGVLHLKNELPNLIVESPASLYNQFPSRTSGTIELWHYPKYDFPEDLLAPGNHIITLGGGRLYMDAFGSYRWAHNNIHTVMANWIADRWNHISFVFDSGKVWIYINGQYGGSSTINLNVNSLGFIESRSREMWVDAIGYSWNSSYNVGDNKKEGLLLSFNTPSDKTMQTIKYSLDGQEAITIFGNTVLSQPIPGTHSIQVFGTDLEGDSYESELRYFSFLREEFATPVGMNIKVVDPKTGIEITFTEIINSGTTTIDKLESIALPLPIGFETTESFYEISTTATNQGTIFITIPYNALLIDGDEEDLRIFKYMENSEWMDITTSIDSINDIIYAEASSLSVFAVLEPDTTEPVVTIDYQNGDKTDGNPGVWNVFAHDLESGINYNTINVMIDGVFAGNVFGDYLVPNTLGEHRIFLEVQNNNPIRPLTNAKSYSIVIGDDDNAYPILGVVYYGGGNDSCPGYFEWKITDEDSGLSEIILSITYNSTCNMANYTIMLPSTESGVWNLPPYLGNYTLTIYARDNDNDREGDSLAIEETYIVTLIDDDTTAPVLTLDHIGETTDEDPGLIQLSFNDPESEATAQLSILGPDGFYYTKNYVLECSDIINLHDIGIFELGIYNITLFVENNDEDGRENDEEKTYSYIILIVEDDDTVKPTITFTEDSYSWDGDLIKLTFTVSAEDSGSGVSEIITKIGGQTFYGEGVHSVSLPSNFYTLEIWATDEDNDRSNDALTKYELYNLIFDLTPPITTATPSGTEGLNGWFISDVVVDMVAEDDTSGVAFTVYSIDGGAWATQYGLFSILIIKEGISTIEFFSIDNVGNKEEWKTLIVKIDRQAPSTSHLLQPVEPDGDNGWYVNPVEITLFPEDITSGVAETYYRVNAGADMIYTGPITFSIDNTYTVEYWSIDEAGLIEGINIANFKIDRTKPITSLIFGDPQFSSDPTYISTETLIELNAIDNLLGSGVKEIYYKIDSGTWQTYDTPFTIESFGFHTVYYYSIDVAGNMDDIKSETVNVNLTELSYLGEFSGNYSDPVTLEAKLIDMATQLPIPDKFIVFNIGTQTVVGQTQFDGVARTSIILTQPGGLYTVIALFEGDDDYLSSFESCGFTIEKEHAYLNYTGFTVVPTTADSIELRATIFEDDDGYWGDLNYIYVTFTIYSVPMDPLNPLQVLGPIMVEFTNIDGIGVATIEIPNLNEGGYLIKVSLTPDENYYHQAEDSDLAILTVYEPSGDFITGGGWIVDSNGKKGNFGFNVKYKKNGMPKGQAIYVYRVGDWEYIVKSNAMLGMAIIHEDNHAYFESKCVIQQYNSKTGELIWSEGNYRMRIDVWDNDKDGGFDVFQIRVYDKIGLLFHEAGFDPYGYLMGGNIVIHIDKKK